MEKLQEMYGGYRNSKINYSDFLTRVVDINSEVNDFDIESAFKHLDTDGTGKITKENMILFFKRKGEDDEHAEKSASQIIKEVNK